MTWSLTQAGAQPAPAPTDPAVGAPAAATPAPPTAAPAAPGPADSARESTYADEQREFIARIEAVVGRPGGLTSEEAGRRAAETSYAALDASQDLASASADVDKAIIAFAPELTVTASYTRLSDVGFQSFNPGGAGGGFVVTTAPEGPLDPTTAPLFSVPADAQGFAPVLNQYYTQLGLTIPLSDYVLRTSQGLTAARAQKDAATLKILAAQLQSDANARVLYYNWVRARLSELVAEQSRVQAKADLEITKRSVAAGRQSKADELRVESQVAAADLLVVRAHNLTELSREQLRITMHDDGPGTYEIGEAVLRAPIPESVAADLDAMYVEALENRVDVRSLDETELSLEEARKAIKAGAWPRFDAFGNVYYASPNPRIFPQVDEFDATWDVGLRLTWSPNSMGTALADARKYDADRARVEAQRGELMDAVKRQVVQAWKDLEAAVASVVAADRALEAATESYRVRRVLYEHGRATSIEVTDAETSLLRARLEVVNARVDYQIARVQLDFATGRTVPDESRVTPRGVIQEGPPYRSPVDERLDAAGG